VICLICGKNYISVGVHIRRKHGVTPELYREEFGLLKTAPLVDEDLSEHLSKNKKAFLRANPDVAAESAVRLKEANSTQRSMTDAMSKAGREKLASRNSARNKEYLTGKTEVVAALLASGCTLKEVQEQTKVAPSTVREMVKAGLVKERDPTEIEQRRLAKVIDTRAKSRAKEIAKILALYDTKLSAMEICRRVGVGYTSYKRWVSNGELPRRSAYMATVSISGVT
jgi:transposase